MKRKLDVPTFISGLMAATMLASVCLLMTGFASHAAELAAQAPPAAVAASAPSPSYKDAKASLDILFATWGSRNRRTHEAHAVDVSGRAMQLLKHRGWLKVDPHDLHSDPWPGKTKFLNVLYTVLGKQSRLIVRSGSALTLHHLIKHSGALAPAFDIAPAGEPVFPDPPAATADSESEAVDTPAATAVSAQGPK